MHLWKFEPQSTFNIHSIIKFLARQRAMFRPYQLPSYFELYPTLLFNLLWSLLLRYFKDQTLNLHIFLYETYILSLIYPFKYNNCSSNSNLVYSLLLKFYWRLKLEAGKTGKLFFILALNHEKNLNLNRLCRINILHKKFVLCKLVSVGPFDVTSCT